MLIPLQRVTCENTCPTGLPNLDAMIAIVVGLIIAFEVARRIGGNHV